MIFSRPPWRPNRSSTIQYPMQVQNGAVVGAWQQDVFAKRAPFSEDYDFTQRQFRRYVDASGAQSVQLPSGFTHHRWQGVKYPYRGSGYLWSVSPVIPGQTRGNYGGFYPRQPSAMQLQTIVQQTAGQQPANPSGFYGPGGIAGPEFDNPMTG